MVLLSVKDELTQMSHLRPPVLHLSMKSIVASYWVVGYWVVTGWLKLASYVA